MAKGDVDLKLRIATKDEAVWEEVAKQCRASLEACNKEIIIQTNILLMAEGKIKAEKAKTT